MGEERVMSSALNELVKVVLRSSIPSEVS